MDHFLTQYALNLGAQEANFLYRIFKRWMRVETFLWSFDAIGVLLALWLLFEAPYYLAALAFVLLLGPAQGVAALEIHSRPPKKVRQ